MANIVRKGEFYKFYRNKPGHEVADKLSNSAAAIQWLRQTKPEHDVYTLAMSDAKTLAKKVFSDQLKHLPHKSTYYRHFQPAGGEAPNHIFFDSRGDSYSPPDYDEPKWRTARVAMDKLYRDRKKQQQIESIKAATGSYFQAYLEVLEDAASDKQAIVNFGKERVDQYLLKLKGKV